MEHREREVRERQMAQARHQPCFSEQLLIELFALVRAVLRDRNDSPNDSQVSTKVDQLIAQVAQNQGIIMAQFAELSAKVDELQTEITEITAYIHGKGSELEAANAEVVRLTALVASLEPNQITQEQRDSLAASQAKVQAAIDALNVFTPAVVEEPPPVDPPVEEPPAEPEEPNISSRRSR